MSGTPNPPGPPSDAPFGRPPGGSTGSHRPPAPSGGSSLSDLLRADAGLPRRPPENTDDAPTVITANRPHVVGEASAVAGRRLGHFELIAPIGAGGMASVLKARDLDLGRVVALKILPPEAAADSESVTRFKGEARAAALLDHDNVARVYFCGEDQGLHFIAFEFVEGSTLRALIDRRGRLPASECVGYMIQVAAGLAHAAERGVVHRDIKPSNIVVTPDGRAKIVDMGLARLDGLAADGGVTQSGVTLGTFDYISPEQALDPRRADVRSDLYSLGCTFYHALTGRPPVPEGTAAKKLHAHQHVDPLDPRELNPLVPDAVAVVLARMMAKDPGRRYQTPAALIADLKQLAGPLGATDFSLSDSVVRAVDPSPSVLPSPVRVPAGVAGVVAALVLVVGALALTSAGGPVPSTRPPWADPPAPTSAPFPLLTATPTTTRPDPATRTNGGTVRTADELVDALRDGRTTRIQLVPGAEYDLTAVPDGVVWRGATLDVVSDPSHLPRVRLRPAAFDPDSAAPRPGGLTLAGAARVLVKGVRFETPAGEAATAADVGLAVVDVADLHLEDCVFGPVGAGTAVAVDRTPGGPAPKVQLNRCLFAGGAVGVRAGPGATVAAGDSAFALTAAAVRVADDSPTPADLPALPTTVTLTRSTVLLDRGAAVEAGGGAGDVRVLAGHCVFAPPADGAPTRGAVVKAGRVDGVRFDGIASAPNAYYRVDALAAGGTPYTFDECRAVPGANVDDKAAVALDRLPWADPDPAATVLAAIHPTRAVRLKLAPPDADPRVFVADPKVRVLGAQFVRDDSPFPRAYADSGLLGWPPSAPAAPDVRRKVWRPDAADGREPGEYDDLVKLLRDVRAGDTVLVRADGPVGVEFVTVAHRGKGGGKAAEFAVTFKPYPGSRPVLTAADGGRADDALFRLDDGDITFEDLTFKVGSGRGKGASRSAVAVAGASRCVFRRCAVTLDEGDGKAAAVAVVDPDGPATRPPPHVEFEGCLVRGKGRLLSVPASRPFELDVRDGVTAVDGPLVAVGPAGKEVDRTARGRVRLQRVTALLGGPVVDLQAGRGADGGGLVPTRVDADGCLFAAVPGANRPLVDVEGVDAPMAADVLSWHRGRPNGYANFDAATQPAVFDPGADGMPARGWEWADWLRFAGEVGRPVGTVRLRNGPAGVKELGGVRAADVAVEGIEFPDMAAFKPGDAGVADPGTVARPADDAAD